MPYSHRMTRALSAVFIFTIISFLQYAVNSAVITPVAINPFIIDLYSQYSSKTGEYLSLIKPLTEQYLDEYFQEIFTKSGNYVFLHVSLIIQGVDLQRSIAGTNAYTSSVQYSGNVTFLTTQVPSPSYLRNLQLDAFSSGTQKNRFIQILKNETIPQDSFLLGVDDVVYTLLSPSTSSLSPDSNGAIDTQRKMIITIVVSATIGVIAAAAVLVIYFLCKSRSESDRHRRKDWLGRNLEMTGVEKHPNDGKNGPQVIQPVSTASTDDDYIVTHDVESVSTLTQTLAIASHAVPNHAALEQWSKARSMMTPPTTRIEPMTDEIPISQEEDSLKKGKIIKSSKVKRKDIERLAQPAYLSGDVLSNHNTSMRKSYLGTESMDGTPKKANKKDRFSAM